MAIRLALLVHHNPHVKAVALSRHLVQMGGGLEANPLASTELVPGVEHCAEVGNLVGLALRRLTDDPVSVEITHCDPDIPRSIEITLLRSASDPASHEPPVELGRFSLRPGYCTTVHLLDADAALVRVVPPGCEATP